jgi:hypothetical protein
MMYRIDVQEYPKDDDKTAMHLKRVYKEVVLRKLRDKATWRGYLAGHLVHPNKVVQYGRQVTVTTPEALEAARRELLADCDPDTGFKVAYYEEVAAPFKPMRGHRASW